MWEMKLLEQYDVFLLGQTYQEHSFARITIFRQWV